MTDRLGDTAHTRIVDSGAAYTRAVPEPGRNFVVTGCGRSGTNYTASLLSELGVRCGHEAVFTPFTTAFAGFGDWQGDSSWLAVPFLGALPAGTVVLHQVRDPEAVVSSFVGIRFFADDGTTARRDLRSRLQIARARGVKGTLQRLTSSSGRERAQRKRSDFVAFLREHCAEAFAEPTERARAARHWVAWNRAAARADENPQLVYARYRVEDLGAPLVTELLATLELDITSAAVEAAVAHLPNTANTRPRREDQDDTPVASYDGVKELAAEYGYSL
jgi:hypothetical protein